MKRTLLIIICLMAMVVSANAQDVLYKNGNVAIETSTYISRRSLLSEPGIYSNCMILIPIERIDEFVSILEQSITHFKKYEKVVEDLDIRSYDNTKVKLKGLHFKTRIAVRTVELLNFEYFDRISTFGKHINFEFYCETKCEIDGSKKPYLILSGKGYDTEIELKFESTYDIMKLIKVLAKDSFTELANKEKSKEELLKIKQQEEENRKKQVESALQQAFN